MKNNTNVVKISQTDFNTILLYAEKISDGQTDLIQVLREELKNKLGIDDADALIEVITNTAEPDINNITRLFLAECVPDLIVVGDDANYCLVKIAKDICELDYIDDDYIDDFSFTNAKSSVKRSDSKMSNENLNSEVSTALTTVTNDINPAPTLQQRIIKIQFHLQTMANSAIIIGQELIECKKEVGHGNWADWLKNNFNLSQESARKFMKIAERFGANSTTSWNLNYSQMAEMLALPAGEEENFIAEKAAKGAPVEKMTVKKLRAEIQDWKKKAAEKETEAEKLKKENDELKNKPPQVQVIETVKTITPPNYAETIQRAEELQEQVDQLLFQQENAQKTIADLQKQIAAGDKQGEPPADYLQLESKLTAARAELVDAQQEIEHAKTEARNAKEMLEAEKHIEQIFQSADALFFRLTNLNRMAFKNYMQKHPDTKDKLNVLRLLHQDFDGYYIHISEEIK